MQPWKNSNTNTEKPNLKRWPKACWRHPRLMLAMLLCFRSLFTFILPTQVICMCLRRISISIHEAYIQQPVEMGRKKHWDNVKTELGGPASAIGGKGATSAKIKGNATFLGASRNVCLHLE
ncbi:hypothetical protein SUGI_1057620 [Cryptomeria japonica]|nr:hypothetical protein SUGI_1057620 [Cryptomeria japonica]